MKAPFPVSLVAATTAASGLVSFVLLYLLWESGQGGKWAGVTGEVETRTDV